MNYGRPFGKKKGMKNQSEIMLARSNLWYTHYFNYLMELSYQLIEWENLPDTINPNFLEQRLHEKGFIAFYEDKSIGFVAVDGANSGTVDKYGMPTHFNPVTQGNISFQIKPFKLYNYNDIIEDDMGVIIGNTDTLSSSVPAIQLFAEDLTELKQTIYINQNAQKTPYILKTNDKNKLSVLQMYNQIDDGVPAIITDELYNTDQTLEVLDLNVPYVVDKLNTQKNNVWNEFMTYLGISNANQDKKERMITQEADSNNEQVEASANRYLKARQESVDKINDYYGLNIKVKLRQSAVEEILNGMGGQMNGTLHSPVTGNRSESLE